MNMEGMLGSLNVPKEKLHVLATLLGNFIVPETELGGFYAGLGIEASSTPEKVSTWVGLGRAMRHLLNFTTDLSAYVLWHYF